MRVIAIAGFRPLQVTAGCAIRSRKLDPDKRILYHLEFQQTYQPCTGYRLIHLRKTFGIGSRSDITAVFIVMPYGRAFVPGTYMQFIA